MGLVTGNKSWQIEFWGDVPPDVIAQAPVGQEKEFIVAWITSQFSVAVPLLGFMKGSKGRVESIDSNVGGPKKFRS